MGEAFDFTWKEAVQSLLPICSEVVLSIGSGGDDNTEELALAWAQREPKIKVVIYPWPNPVADIDWWVTWINQARQHLKTDFMFQLDADEVLAEWSYPEVREFIQSQSGELKPGNKQATGIVTRYNFWRDHRHLIPKGHCCGWRVIRLAPTGLWLGSDAPHPLAQEAMARSENTGIEIFHYGFLRRHEALFEKGRANGMYFFGNVDARVEASAKEGAKWMEGNPFEWCNSLDDYKGEHPEIAKPWLVERGWT